MEEKVKARILEIEVEFKKVQQESNELIKVQNDKQALLIRLDGEYAGLKKLLGEDKIVDIKK